MGLLGMPLLPKCSPDLKYGPWPPTRDWGSPYQALLVADWPLYKRLCPSSSLSVSLCAQVEKTSISAPAHSSATCVGCVSSLRIQFFFLVKTKHFSNNTRMGASRTIFFCIYQTLISGVSFLHILVFMKCQKWRFWNVKNGVSEMLKMAFLKRQKWRFWNAKNSVSETPKMA